MAGDVEYFGRRAIEEQAAADNASDLRAREAHLQMAERYNELAQAIAAQETLLGTHSLGEFVS
jgi:hypothetical protein